MWMTWVWEWVVEVLTLLVVEDNNSLFTSKEDSQVEDSLGVVSLEDLGSIFDDTCVISFLVTQMFADPKECFRSRSLSNEKN